jgi:DUF3048 family protein
MSHRPRHGTASQERFAPILAAMKPPHRRRHSPISIAAGALVVATGLGACSGEREAAAPARTTTTPSPTTSTTTAPALLPLRGGPVLAVKIDNTSMARPRIGLHQADVVYVEPVEGGLTRLLAVFSSQMPKEVGPVRSARESDVELVANYGRVALAYSGGSAYTLPILARGKQINLSFDSSGSGYHRDRSRPAPYNVIGNTHDLLERAKSSVPPKDPGFRFGPAAAGGRKASVAAARWSAARMTFTWNAKRKQYLVATDGKPDVGADNVQHGAATVVVQYVETHMSRNRDTNGRATPVVELTGKGKVTVLRDGKAWNGSWSRRAAASPTTFAAGGKPLTFAPGGPVWVLLVGPGQSIAVA